MSKCVLNTANRCEPANRLCNEYGTSIKVDGKSFTLDSCESLFPGEGKDRCDRTTSGGCQGYKDECTGLTGDDCTNNIPRDHSKSCGIVGTACQGIKRKCNDAYLLNYHKNEMNKEFCKTLEPSTGDGKKCHYNYDEEKCQDYYEKCSDFKGTASEDSCLNFKPLFTDDENYFDDEIHKCVLDGTTCKFAEKTCSDFPPSGNDRYLCERLTTKTNNKACHYDPNYEGNKCQEQFFSCQLFYENLETQNKKKANCESFRAPHQNTNCVWEKESSTDSVGTCKNPYGSCNEYDAYIKNEYEKLDKKKCESIREGEWCILDKDENCINKELICEEALTKEECNNAKPAIQGLTELVSRKICEFVTGKGCIENYKYCSDYRAIGVDADTAKEVCERIKPYNSGGTGLDNDYECVYDREVGCQKQKKPCNKATSNSECNSFCEDLKTSTSHKYYYYTGSTCSIHYTECQYAPITPSATTCTGNIPTSLGQCEVDTTNNKCKDKTATTPEVPTSTCASFFTDEYKRSVCENINPQCVYSSSTGTCTQKEIEACSQITKTDFPGLMEEHCNLFPIEINKICSLKSDGSGCEEKTKAPTCNGQPIIPQENTNNQETAQCEGYSSRLKVYEMQLIIVLLCLLI